MTQLPCLLLHGLTASPTQLVPLQEALTEAGFEVTSLLLPGHGTNVEDLAQTSWRDWYAAAREAAQKLGPRINVVGLSMGALLALRLAMEEPTLVDRLVCISPALALPGWMRGLIALVRYSPLRWILRRWPKDYTYAVRDPEGRAIYKASSYSEFPLPAVLEFVDLQAVVRAGLSRVTAPTLILHPRRDTTAHPSGARMIADQVQGPNELVWLDESYHVATLDLERDLICQKVLAFLQSSH